jgi:hypothetical protein
VPWFRTVGARISSLRTSNFGPIAFARSSVMPVVRCRGSADKLSAGEAAQDGGLTFIMGRRNYLWLIPGSISAAKIIIPRPFTTVLPQSFPFHNHLRAFAFAGVKDDGLMCGGLTRCGTAAMGVAVEVELALAKSGPQQSGCGRRHNHQGNHCLPVHMHVSNISGGLGLAICFSKWRCARRLSRSLPG